MNKLIIILFFPFVFASCTTEDDQSEMTENMSTSDTVKKELMQPIDYIPPNTNESSAGDTKRKRKFYIRE